MSVTSGYSRKAVSRALRGERDESWGAPLSVRSRKKELLPEKTGRIVGRYQILGRAQSRYLHCLCRTERSGENGMGKKVALNVAAPAFICMSGAAKRLSELCCGEYRP